MPRYYSTKAAVPLGQGQSLGFKGGKKGGYYARGPVLSDQAYVTRDIDKLLAPIISQLQSRGQQTSQNVGGIYEALAAEQAKVAPAVQETYQQFGDQTSALAKGYSDAFRMTMGESAEHANEILAQQGSPQQVASGSGAADVLYGLGGSIPGQAIAREGAAFTAAAQQLPGQARAMGAQERLNVGADVEEQIRKLEAEKPGLIQKALSELQSARAQQSELELKQALASQEFGLDLRKQEFNETATSARIGNERSRIGLSQQRLALDKAKLDIDFGFKQAGLTLSKKKQTLAEKKEARLAKAPKSGGFTAGQKQRFRGVTREMVEWAAETTQPPVAVLRTAMAKGVPFSIAIKVIQNAAATRFKDDPLWEATFGWTK